MSISVSIKKKMTIRGNAADVFRAASDIARTGVFAPGVADIKALGQARFAWTLERQSAFGLEMAGEYVTQHVMEEEEGRISWTTVSGNMESSGCYRIEEIDGGVSVTGEIATVLPLNVPPVVRTPASLYIQHQLVRQIVDLFKAIEQEQAISA